VRLSTTLVRRGGDPTSAKNVPSLPSSTLNSSHL